MISSLQPLILFYMGYMVKYYRRYILYLAPHLLLVLYKGCKQCLQPLYCIVLVVFVASVFVVVVVDDHRMHCCIFCLFLFVSFPF